MNIQQSLQQASTLLLSSSDTALLDVQVLLCFVLQCNSAHLAAWPEKDLTEQQAEKFLQLIQQRKNGLPVAHLTGQREFWSLDFLVNDSTLIPRPETETLIEFVVEKFSDRKNIKLLDMGTGCGAIAIAIASEKPAWEIHACEFSKPALTLAKKNSKKLKTENITFTHSNWFSNILTQDFDIIISNPPYIAENDAHLFEGDVRFEPRSALTSGETGMDDIEHICATAKQYMTDNGWLIVEHGYNQAQLVNDCFSKNGYIELEQIKDLSGHIRMTAGK